MSGGSASEIWSLRSGDRISRDCEIVVNWEGLRLYVCTHSGNCGVRQGNSDMYEYGMSMQAEASRHQGMLERVPNDVSCPRVGRLGCPIPK